MARRVGGIPEIVRDGIDGIVDDSTEALARRLDEVAGLDRTAIRASVLERFSAVRMTDDYEAVYRRLIRRASRPATRSRLPIDPAGSDPDRDLEVAGLPEDLGARRAAPAVEQQVDRRVADPQVR